VNSDENKIKLKNRKTDRERIIKRGGAANQAKGRQVALKNKCCSKGGLPK